MITQEDIQNIEKRGIVMHPLNGKIPILQGWQFLKKSPELNAHIQKGGNIGGVCGANSNITVIDMDSMLFDEELGLSKIDTFKVQRTKGRMHVYFKYNPDLPASKHHDLGIEVLSDGNNIVLPPSVHPSGDIYKELNPVASIIKMDAEIERKLNSLFRIEKELKQYLRQTRTCFRDIIKRRPDMHGADGREYMIAVATDLKAAGAKEQHILMFAKIMYAGKFDAGRTLQEWGHIDASRTWTCETIEMKLGHYLDVGECESCKKRREKYKEALNDIKIIDYSSPTDLNNSRFFAKTYDKDIRYCHLWKSWLYWDGGRWKKDDSGRIYRYGKHTMEIIRDNILSVAQSTTDAKIKEKLEKKALSVESKNKIIAMIELAQSEPEMPISPDALDQNKWAFNVQNGIVDLISGELKPFDKDEYITKISPVIYDKNATCPLWIKFLDRIFEGKKELIEYIQKIAGHALTGDAREEQLYIFWGTGANGKSTLLETLKYILGEYSMTIAIDTLLEKRSEAVSNEIARLKGARFVVASEPDFGKNLSEGKIKTLTGKDTINARFLYQESFQFKPEFKLVIATNHKPGIKGADYGIWRRLKMVPFEVTIPPDERDKTLDLKLINEASGILNWMIEGCLKWQQEGINDIDVIRNATSDYQDEMDSLNDFFTNLTISDANRITPHIFLYTAYKLWAEYNETLVVSKKAFTQILIERGFKKIRAYLPDGRRVRAICGLSGTDVVMTSVLKYISAPDAESRGIVRDEWDRYMSSFHNFSTENNISIGEARNNMSYVSHLSPVSNITNILSVPNLSQKEESVLINKYEMLIDKLDIVYNGFEKPNDNIFLERLKHSMKRYLLTECELESKGQDIDEIVTDYCTSKGLV